MINLPEFRAALRKVAHAATKTSTLPALQCFAFSGGRVSCSDGTIICSTPVEFPVEGIVQADALLTWLAALPASATELKATKGPTSLKFEAGKASARLSLGPIADFPPISIPQADGDWVPTNRDAVLQAAKLCRGYMLDDFGKNMGGLALGITDGNLWFRSTNRFGAVEIELALESVDEPPGERSCCIPASAVDHLVRAKGAVEMLLPGDVTNSAIAWFRCGDVLVGSRVAMSDWADQLAAGIARANWELPMSQVTKELCEAFAVVLPVAKKVEYGQIQATLWEGRIALLCTSETVFESRGEAAFAHVELELPLDVSFNGPMLDHVLPYVDELQFPKDPLAPIMFRSDCIRGILAPIRPRV